MHDQTVIIVKLLNTNTHSFEVCYGVPKSKVSSFYTCIAERRNVTVMHVVNALGRNPLLEVLRKDLFENKCDKNHYAFWGFRAAAIPFGILTHLIKMYQ
jgi:hypothetical protein